MTPARPTPTEALRGIDRVRLAPLLMRFPTRAVWAAYVLVNASFTIAVLAAVSRLTGTMFLLPPLGATVFLFFFTPGAPTASPRNAVLSYAIAIAAGYAALALTGLVDAPAASATTLDSARIAAVALSAGLAGAGMVLFDAVHPPAGATTLVISLGIVTRLPQLAALEGAVILAVLPTLVIHRVAGVAYPLWSARKVAPGPTAAP